MQKNVCVALADGFEEIEGLTVVDLLRRAGIHVTAASISSQLEVHGSHDIHVIADALFQDVDISQLDMLVLPGGLVGTNNLRASSAVTDALQKMLQDGKQIAAICAAPSVLGGLGLLKGKKAACYPGFEDKLVGADVTFAEVAADEQVITSRGLGTAIPFSLALITRLLDQDTADQIAASIVYRA